MYEDFAYDLDNLLNGLEQKRTGIFLILVTNGGDAHAAYMVGRTLQRQYGRNVTICISGDCYSAGTIAVMSANSLVITDSGRMGPLDFQILKKDELGERLSGLTLKIAMGELRAQTYDTFEQFLFRLKRQFRSQLSPRMAMDVAAKMATDLYSEVYKQMDPLKIGEDVRAMHIAEHYGDLLSRKSGNVKQGAIQRLLETYPSHSCVIDRDEASELFTSVKEPNDRQQALLDMLEDDARFAEDAVVLVLSTTIKQQKEREDIDTPTKRADEDAASNKPGDRIGRLQEEVSSRSTKRGNGKAEKGSASRAT